MWTKWQVDEMTLYRALYGKTLWTCNLRQIDRFRSKLVSFLLSVTKPTTLHKQVILLQDP